MNDLLNLLNNRWIIKKKNPDLYFRVKDNLRQYQDFVREKLGYTITVNPLLIKIEKLAGKPQSWMGINTFDSIQCYVFFIYILMFLEEKEPEEQFVLSQITDFIHSQPEIQDQIDWTSFTQRKTLIKVLEFSKENHLIKINDGDDRDFVNAHEAVEVLYENTGLSKYFMRRFPFDITEINSLKAFNELDWQNDDGERGVMRRHRIYRRLILEPVVYKSSFEDQDYLYIKNMRSVLAHDFDHYLGADFHVHKNGAMILFQDNAHVRDALPSRKNISDIVFQCCKEIRDRVISGDWVRNSEDKIMISKVKWDMFLEEIQTKYSPGWSKLYRDLSMKAFKKEINEMMHGFGLIEMEKNNNSIWIMPASGKLSGNYPKEFWKKQEESSKNVMEN